MTISVLISVFIGCESNKLKDALDSIWYQQLRKPDQIVLVMDGPVQESVEKLVVSYKHSVGDAMVIKKLKKSNGFANALNQGLALCTSDYIARMDSDDISLPNRFKDQYNYLQTHKSIDVLGSWISEIDDLNNVTRSVVKYPLSHNDCFEMFKYRDPVAHPSVMFRKNFFERSGLYRVDVPLFEDTVMWFQGFKYGCQFGNLQKVCLEYRRSTNFFKKRSDFKKGFQLLWFRVSIINPELKYGFKGNVYAFIYFFMNLTPASVRRMIYQKFR